jgi:hypothetical protein
VQYLGIDIHSQASGWCLVGANSEVRAEGRAETTVPVLDALVKEPSAQDGLRRRDAYWIARTLQTGMHPHPVYLPTGEVRELRALLTRRRMIQADRIGGSPERAPRCGRRATRCKREGTP